MTPFSIAIDGPAGAGKSTIAKQLANDLGCIYIDTGAMYRAVGLYCIKNNIDYTAQDATVLHLPSIQIDITYAHGAQKIYLNTEDVTTQIRTDAVAKAASKVATYEEVRHSLVKMQQQLALEKSIVMDGRDIGTVVLPNATLKIFLVASAEERANRRYQEYTTNNVVADKDVILADILARDHQDYNRIVSPLKKAKDATEIDSSYLSIEEVVTQIKSLLKKKIACLPKKVLVAKTAGFCFGVERAVRLAFDTSTTSPTFTFGPIIHNEAVVNQLIEEKEIFPIDAIEDKEINTLIIRSHGVGKNIYETAQEKNIHIVDATCPYVKKIHRLVEKYLESGYKILVIGDADHPEIVGINGWSKNTCIIVKNVTDAKLKDLSKEEKYLVVSQTTYKLQVVEEILSYLSQMNYVYEHVNTICNATTERQDEAVAIAKKVDAMIIIGSKYSSNTQKLYELCQKECPTTYCIDSIDDLDCQSLQDKSTIGITAGASTPNYIIDAVVAQISDL